MLEGRGKLRESDTAGGTGAAGATGAADDHEVNVASRLLLLSSERAVDESDRDAVPEWPEARCENISEPSGSEKEPVKVAEDRALGLSLVVCPVSVFPPPQNPRPDKARNFSLQARWRHPDVPSEV